jgi:hypothetical protein
MRLIQVCFASFRRFGVLGALCAMGGTAHADEIGVAIAPPVEVAQARSEIDSTLAQMKAVSLRVREDLRVTRKRGTKVQIACVDEALSRADVATRRARETGDVTLAAYARGEVDVARAARHRLGEIRHSQSLAARDGASCSASGRAVVASSTTVKMDVDPRIPRVP